MVAGENQTDPRKEVGGYLVTECHERIDGEWQILARIELILTERRTISASRSTNEGGLVWTVTPGDSTLILSSFTEGNVDSTTAAVNRLFVTTRLAARTPRSSM